MPQIVFPMTLDYVKHWTPWDVVREFVSNAYDADENFTMQQDGATLRIEDWGEGLEVKHLLMGKSEKNNTRPRGQFGEGLDLALLCLTRWGVMANIYTRGLHIWNQPAYLDGIDEKVLGIAWEEGDFRTKGTLVEIENWCNPSFDERIIRKGDARIVYTDNAGRSILRMDQPAIFVRDIWVCDAERLAQGKGFAFGYNLVDTPMNRDRGIVDSWNACNEMGRIWGSVTDSDLMVEFWQAVKDRNGERNVNIYDIQNTDQSRAAIQKVFGWKAVAVSTQDMKREAEYRGARVLDENDIGHRLKAVVTSLLGTDAQFVTDIEGKAAIYVPEKKLDGTEKKTLAMLRRIAAKVGIFGSVDAYILPGKDGEAANGKIRIGRETLQDPVQAIATLVHEGAHVKWDTKDYTVEHERALTEFAAQIIAQYVVR